MTCFLQQNSPPMLFIVRFLPPQFDNAQILTIWYACMYVYCICMPQSKQKLLYRFLTCIYEPYIVR